MGKLSCNCGNTIVDQADNIPYKAIFVRDQDWDAYGDWSEDVDAFVNAIKTGKRDAWIKNYFSKSYPTTLSDSSIISDIISRKNDLEGEIFQCEQCGRIKIQIRDTNAYATFAPEQENCMEIFKGLTISTPTK